jgi:hypothetical protein
MRIKNRYSVDATKELIALLDQNSIRYEVSTLSSPAVLHFYLYDDDSRKTEIEQHIASWNMLIPEVTFSKTEYEEAQWFRFMPKYDRIPSCESELVYSYFCQKPNGTIDYDSHHLRQIGTYRLRHRPRWPSPQCILSSEGNHDHEWFINDTTRKLFEDADICGLRFAPVIHERSGQSIADIHQIIFDYDLPEEALVLGKENGITSIVSCESCGEKRYYVSPRTYQLCLYGGYLGDHDVYVTRATFGQGYGYRMVIGSKNFYRFIKENKMAKYFDVHPIKVISNGDFPNNLTW